MCKLAILTLCLAALTVIVTADDHSIDDCVSPGNQPVVLYDQELKRDGRASEVQEQNIRIPEKGFADRAISCITIVNRMTDTDGGYPYIKEGGVGYRYVDIYLKSQRGQAFDFQVTVYYDKG